MVEITKKNAQQHLQAIEDCFVQAHGSVKETLSHLSQVGLQLSKTSFYRILKSEGFFERPRVVSLTSKQKNLRDFLVSLKTGDKTVPEIISILTENGFGTYNQAHMHGILKRFKLSFKRKDPTQKVHLHLAKSNRAPRGEAEIRNFVTEKGWSLLKITDTKGIDLAVKGKLLELRCPQGHPKITPLIRFFQKQNCLSCTKAEKREQYERKLKDLFSSHSMEYLSSKGQDVLATCSSGHTFSVLFSNFKKNNSCPECYFGRKGFSLAEVEIVEYIKSIYQGTIEIRDRNTIKPLELDIFLPELKLAIEYHGLYFHSYHPNRASVDIRCKFKTEEDAKTYHRRKLDACTKQGIRLVSMFEDEWLFKKTICQSKIRNLVGRSQRKYARNLKVVELNSQQASAFMNENHLQGHRGGYALGLVDGETIYSVLILSAPLRSHTASRGTVEISRFASLCGYNIVGGFSRLLKAARVWAKDRGFKKIKTHCDLRWGIGGVYEKAGFIKLGETKYTPHYVKSLKRFRNQSLKKTSAERLTGKTEKALRFEQGYSIIYDCGHSVWELGLS